MELARLAVMDGAWEETLDLSNHAIALDPIGYPLAFYINALANVNLRRPDEAESSARSALRLDNQHRIPQIHLLLARILRQKRDAAGEAAQLAEFLKYSSASAHEAEMVAARLRRLVMSYKR